MRFKEGGFDKVKTKERDAQKEVIRFMGENKDSNEKTKQQGFNKPIKGMV